MNPPIERDQILKEIKESRAILTKWVKRIENPGIPAVDQPGSDEAMEEFIGMLGSELLLVAGRCESLSNVLIGPR